MCIKEYGWIKHKYHVCRIFNIWQIFNMDVWSSGEPRIFWYAGSQLQNMGPRWNLWRVILDLNDEFFLKKILRSEFAKKIFFFSAPANFFLFLLVFRFLEFNRDLHWISSTDFKFHLEISIRSGVMPFRISAAVFGPCFQNPKCHNSWTDRYF